MSETSTPRIERLVIESLFGEESLTVDIPFRLEERVTLLHGRNGSGKTITLQLLHALREGRYEALLAYPFKRLEISLTDGSSLSVVQHQAKPEWVEMGSRNDSYMLLVNQDERELRFEKKTPNESHHSSAWRGYPKTKTAFSYQDPNLHQFIRLARRAGLMKGSDTAYDNTYDNRHVEVDTFLDHLPPIKLIPIERLRPETKVFDIEGNTITKVDPTIQRISEDIRELVKAADREYRRISTQLDGSLASRLFQKPAEAEELPLDALKRRYKELDEKERQLASLGLLTEPSKTVDERDMTESQRTILQTILLDREKKLAPFDKVVSKSQRLIQSINRKLAPKSVKLNVDTGYQIFTASNQPLPLEKLSSGEQHELVLLHELLFDVQEGSLILIDEPELSLHIAWQEEFVPDLMAIAELSRLDFLLATHSPYIVGNHEALMVRQGAPVQ